MQRLRFPTAPTCHTTLVQLVVVALVVAVPESAQSQPGCDPLPPPSGTTVTAGPSQAGQLRSIVAGAAPGTTILLEDGTYALDQGDNSSRLSFNQPNVTLRSASGNAAAVILDGNYDTDELISIHASNVTIADLTVQRAWNHPIHISGNDGAPIVNPHLLNLRVIDPGQQAIKVNANGNGYVDYGVIECSTILLTATGRSQIRDNCYTGGIDVHKAWGWEVRRNWIEGFWCDEGLSEHAIHFWTTSRDTLVEENVMVNNARGVGYGLREDGPSRDYPDDPYPNVGYMGHIDGIIRNNFIAADSAALFNSQFGFDTGIGLEQAHGAGVYHNTVASTSTPASSSIEWRWANTSADIANNLVTDRLLERNGAQATETSNLEFAPLSYFVDVPAGDLHLQPTASGAIDGGAALSGLVDGDFDLQSRDASPDIGADEYGLPSALFSDGFESGNPGSWDAIVGSS